MRVFCACCDKVFEDADAECIFVWNCSQAQINYNHFSPREHKDAQWFVSNGHLQPFCACSSACASTLCHIWNSACVQVFPTRARPGLTAGLLGPLVSASSRTAYLASQWSLGGVGHGAAQPGAGSGWAPGETGHGSWLRTVLTTGHPSHTRAYTPPFAFPKVFVHYAVWLSALMARLRVSHLGPAPCYCYVAPPRTSRTAVCLGAMLAILEHSGCICSGVGPSWEIRFTGSTISPVFCRVHLAVQRFVAQHYGRPVVERLRPLWHLRPRGPPLCCAWESVLKLAVESSLVALYLGKAIPLLRVSRALRSAFSVSCGRE